MKVGGQAIEGLNQAVLVLPRYEHELVFRAQAIPDLTEFHIMYPPPKPPVVLKAGGVKEDDVEDKGYKQQLANFARLRTAYMVVKSLEPSEIEWDTVDTMNPKTYSRWDTDFRNAGLNEIEIQRVVDLVMEANCLDDDKIKWARDNFFARGQQSNPSE